MLPGIQVWNVNFCLKKYVKFGRMIKSALFNVWSIACYTSFPSFGQFVNTMSVKIVPFCCESFIESCFHIFVRTKAILSKCVTHRRSQVVMGTSQVWWIRNFPAECFRCVTNRFCRTWSIALKKNNFVLLTSVFRPFWSRERFKSCNCCW